MIKAIVTACLLLALIGCSMQPWVRPYERAKLAYLIMSFDRDPVSSS